MRLCQREVWPLIAFAATVSACAPGRSLEAPAPAAGTVAQSVIHLTDADVGAIAALIRLEDRREFDAAALREHLAAESPEVRRRAALTIGRIADPRGADLLQRTLSDPSADVRADAAFALGQLGDSSATIIDALATRVLDPAEDPTVRTEVAAALGKLRSASARTVIITLLEEAAGITRIPGRQPPPPGVVGEALLASWKFQRDPKLTTAIVRLASSPDPELRWRATYALMRLGDPAGVETLLERHRDTEPLVRALAARGLRVSVVDTAGLRDEAIAALSSATSDPHPHVRINALAALARFHAPGSTARLIQGLADSDRNVRLAAVEALAVAGDSAAVAALEGISGAKDEPLALRSAALAGLLRSNPGAALPIARELAGDNTWLARFYAARALGTDTSTAGIELLTDLARDPDPRVAATALSGLASIAPDQAPGLERLFIEQLGAADLGIRAAALRGLARRATATHLPLLFDAYERTRTDPENDAARAAVEALGALARQGVPVQNSFFRRFPRSDDPVVRREVGEKIGAGWGPATPIETGREPGFYEEIVRTYVAPRLAGEPAPHAIIHTAGGAITVELATHEAPLTVHNFITLAEKGYFDGFRWHRVVPNFVLQDGDPRGDGSGGPGYTIRDEFNRVRYLRGTIGMALDGPDTGGSQFFIAHSPQPHLDGRYTSFGQVVDGIDVADGVAQDDPIFRIEITRNAAPRTAADDDDG